MFCNKCGKPQKENAKFCSSCGSPLKRPEAGATGTSGMQPPPVPQPPVSAAQPVGPQPPVSPHPPAAGPSPPATYRKSNTRLIVILAMAAVVVAGGIVAVILLTSKPASAPLPSAAAQVTAQATEQASPAATASAGATAPAGTDVSLRVFSTPSLDTSEKIESVLTGSAWEIAGIAHNPDQKAGNEGEYTLALYADFYERLTFTDDGKFRMYTEASGEVHDDSYTYEITGTNYCDSEKDEEGDYLRFYLAADGNLYATIMYEGDPYTDFCVYAPKPLGP
ncbi:MAG: zinc ribbon domain-containing protein [Christensenellales bacterium]|jgi:hypothetical protein